MSPQRGGHYDASPGDCKYKLTFVSNGTSSCFRKLVPPGGPSRSRRRAMMRRTAKAHPFECRGLRTLRQVSAPGTMYRAPTKKRRFAEALDENFGDARRPGDNAARRSG